MYLSLTFPPPSQFVYRGRGLPSLPLTTIPASSFVSRSLVFELLRLLLFDFLLTAWDVDIGVVTRFHPVIHCVRVLGRGIQLLASTAQCFVPCWPLACPLPVFVSLSLLSFRLLWPKAQALTWFSPSEEELSTIWKQPTPLSSCQCHRWLSVSSKGTRLVVATLRNSEATSGASRGEFLFYVFCDTKSSRYYCLSPVCLTGILHVCWLGFFKAWCCSGSHCVGSPAFRFELNLWFPLFRLFCLSSFVAWCAHMSQIPVLLTLVNELPVTNLCETRKRNGTKCLELQKPLIFFSFLIMGSALLPMASTRKELALLGGTFLFGYGALEMVLRMGGYWVNSSLHHAASSSERKPSREPALRTNQAFLFALLLSMFMLVM